MAQTKPRKQDPTSRTAEVVARTTVAEGLAVRIARARREGKPPREIAKLQRQYDQALKAQAKGVNKSLKAADAARVGERTRKQRLIEDRKARAAKADKVKARAETKAKAQTDKAYKSRRDKILSERKAKSDVRKKPNARVQAEKAKPPVQAELDLKPGSKATAKPAAKPAAKAPATNLAPNGRPASTVTSGPAKAPDTTVKSVSRAQDNARRAAELEKSKATRAGRRANPAAPQTRTPAPAATGPKIKPKFAVDMSAAKQAKADAAKTAAIREQAQRKLPVPKTGKTPVQTEMDLGSTKPAKKPGLSKNVGSKPVVDAKAEVAKIMKEGRAREAAARNPPPRGYPGGLKEAPVEGKIPRPAASAKFSRDQTMRKAAVDSKKPVVSKAAEPIKTKTPTPSKAAVKAAKASEKAAKLSAKAGDAAKALAAAKEGASKAAPVADDLVKAGADAAKKPGIIRRVASKLPGLKKLAPAADDVAKVAGAATKKAGLLRRGLGLGGKVLGKAAVPLMIADIANQMTAGVNTGGNSFSQESWLDKTLGTGPDEWTEDDVAFGGKHDAQGNRLTKSGGFSGLGQNFKSGKGVLNFAVNNLLTNPMKIAAAAGRGLGSAAQGIWAGDFSNVVNPADPKNWVYTNTGELKFNEKRFTEAMSGGPDYSKASGQGTGGGLSQSALRDYQMRREQGLLDDESPEERARMQEMLVAGLGADQALTDPAQDGLRGEDNRAANAAKLEQYMLGQTEGPQSQFGEQAEEVTGMPLTPDPRGGAMGRRRDGTPDTRFMNPDGQSTDFRKLGLKPGQAYVPKYGGVVSNAGYEGKFGKGVPRGQDMMQRSQQREQVAGDTAHAREALTQMGIDPDSPEGQEKTRRHLAAAARHRQQEPARAEQLKGIRAAVMASKPGYGIAGKGKADKQFGDDEMGAELNKMSRADQLRHFGDQRSASTSRKNRAKATEKGIQRGIDQRKRTALNEENRTRTEQHDIAVAKAKGREVDPRKDERQAVIDYIKPNRDGIAPKPAEIMENLLGLDPNNKDDQAAYKKYMRELFGTGAGADATETDETDKKDKKDKKKTGLKS